MLYTSKMSGRREIYCVEWPTGAKLQQVSTNGGNHATWSRDGSRILFAGEPVGSGYFQVDVTREPSISFSTPRPLFDGDFDYTNYLGFTPSRDGDRFVTVRLANTEEQRDPYFISLIENWDAPFRDGEQR